MTEVGPPVAPPRSGAACPISGTAGGGTALVLGAGGARGIAHAAVLRRLCEARIPFEVIVGCSAGSLVGAVWAACGLEPEDILALGADLRPFTLLAWASSGWLPAGLRARARGGAGRLEEAVGRLRRAEFTRLRPPLRGLGVLTLDFLRRRELFVYGGPGVAAPMPLWSAVRASVAIPGLFPPVLAPIGARRRPLADPGWFTAVPIERAFAPPVRAQRVIAVDLRLRVCLRQNAAYWSRMQETCGDRLVVLRPEVRGCGTIIARRGDAARLAAAADAAVDEAMPALRRLTIA
jgi:NTE family protein